MRHEERVDRGLDLAELVHRFFSMADDRESLERARATKAIVEAVRACFRKQDPGATVISSQAEPVRFSRLVCEIGAGGHEFRLEVDDVFLTCGRSDDDFRDKTEAACRKFPSGGGTVRIDDHGGPVASFSDD